MDYLQSGSWRSRALTGLAAVLMMLAGCSGSDSGEVLRTVPAGGTVLFKGQPLEYYQVIFKSSTGQRPAAGISGPQGRFVLGTNTEGDGAPPGDYQVALTYVGPPSTDPNEGMNEFSTPPPPKVKLPPRFSSSEKSGLTATVPSRGDTELRIEIP